MMRHLNTAFTLLLLAAVPVQAGQAIETGTVNWERDLPQAQATSRADGRPVFLLFQEVPGCAGCQKFGKQVLSHPLLVEAIEEAFVPVLVFNNRSGGSDVKLLKQFGEPAWNYQVVRFLDAAGRDLIPRRDRVWTLGPLATRMVEALQAAKRPVPPYLLALAREYDPSQLQTCALAMSCFWTGEHRLGQVDGVVTTEAGWLDGREVTRVTYRNDLLSLPSLVQQAAQAGCAQKVYLPAGVSGSFGHTPAGVLDQTYRRAKSSDQKKQLERWTALQKVPHLTEAQRTKLNAFAPNQRDQALRWLSPRQRAALGPQ